MIWVNPQINFTRYVANTRNYISDQKSFKKTSKNMKMMWTLFLKRIKIFSNHCLSVWWRAKTLKLFLMEISIKFKILRSWKNLLQSKIFLQTQNKMENKNNRNLMLKNHLTKMSSWWWKEPKVLEIFLLQIITTDLNWQILERCQQKITLMFNKNK